MARKWMHYTAQAEGFLKHNVFPGPLKEDDVFIHYLRQGVLGNGTDFFGVYASNHTAWLAAQPKDLGLKGITLDAIPTDNPHTKLAARRRDERMDAIATDTERAKAAAEYSVELAAKGLGDS